MTTAILGLLLQLTIVPMFLPTIGGVHDAQEQVGNGLRWYHILRTGELEQPDGAMIVYKEHF